MADDDKQTNTLTGLPKEAVVPAVGSQEQKEANTAAQEAANGGTTVSDDFFTNPDVKALTQLPTALDHQGNERIIGVTADNWELPPSEVSAEQIAAAEAREAADAEAQKIRLSGGAAAQSLTSDESGAANATPGVGGSS
jgi:hypothetical protein